MLAAQSMHGKRWTLCGVVKVLSVAQRFDVDCHSSDENVSEYGASFAPLFACLQVLFKRNSHHV